MTTYQTVQNPYHVQDENGDIVGYLKDRGNEIVFTPRFATNPLTGKATGLVGPDGDLYGGIVKMVDPTSPSTIAQQVQAFHDEMPNGGAIYIPPCETVYDWTAQVNITKPVLIYALQQPGGSTPNASRPAALIRVASGIKAIYHGQAASALFCGAALRGLSFFSADGTGWAVYNDKMSHCVYEDLRINDFSNGVGIEFVSNAGQYSRITRTFIHGTKTGIKITDQNGIVIDGCYIDPVNNSAAPMAASIGVHVTNASADTILIVNTQMQGCDVCVDTSGQYTTVDNCRFEIFNTAVIFRGDRETVKPGCSFNNNIYNSSGICVDIKAGANICEVFPFRFGAVSPEPVRDAGTKTKRLDGIVVTRVFDTISATGSYMIGDFPENAGNGTYYCRYAYLHTGDTAQAADAVNYWTVAMLRVQAGGGTQGVNGTLNSIAGWGLNSKQTFNTATNNNALNAGDQVRANFTKTGAPPNLTQVSISFLLVPY